MFLAQCIHAMGVGGSLAVSLFLAGLVGGFTHCAGMCAPFVLAQVDGRAGLQKLGSALLIPYHLGRMTTYVVLAVLVSSVVNLVFVFSGAKVFVSVPMLLLAGVIFMVSAFPRFAALFPWAARISVSAPFRALGSLSSRLTGRSGPVSRYGLGVLLGFMPCGMVVSALLASAAAPSVLESALAMAAFAAGTVPALVIVALGGHIIKRKYPVLSARLTQGAMVISGLWLFVLAGTMVF